MKTNDLIIKHLNALTSKYQLEIDLLLEMKKKPTNELHQAEIDININYFEEEIKEIKDIVDLLEREEKNYTLIPMGDLSKVKSIRINPFKEASTDLQSTGTEKTFASSYQEELIKEAETLLNEFKQSDDFAKNELAINMRNDFFDKFHDSFPDFCFILGRTLDSYYTIEVSEKYIEFLKILDYREAEKKMLIWYNENLYKL